MSRASLGLVVCVALWGLVFIAVHELLPVLGAAQIVTLRFVLVAAVFAGLFAARPGLRPRFTRREWRVAVAAGVLAVPVSQFALVDGQRYLSPPLASLIITTAPAVAAVLGAVLLDERLGPRQITGLVVAFIGVAVIVVVGAGSGAELGASDPLRASIIVIGPVSWAVYSLLSKPLSIRYHPITVVGAILLVGTVPLIPLIPNAVDGLAGLSAGSWAWLVFMAIGGTAAPYLLWSISLQSMEVSRTTAFLYLVPFFATTWSVLLLGSALTALTLAGGAIIVLGVVLTQQRSSTGRLIDNVAPMFPDQHAEQHPDRNAYVMARAGVAVTYAELTERSRRAARLMRQLGAEHGDTVALLLENHVRLLELAWAAQRTGLRYTAISPRLTVEEVAYILEDSGSRQLFAGAATAEVALAAAEQACVAARISVDGPLDGFDDYASLLAALPDGALEDEVEGVEFLYSSGTTGRPKAIKSALALHPIGTPPAIVPLFEKLYGFGSDTVYLSPAPLYHSAPLRFNMAVHRLGGTTIVMEKFDPLWMLELIERHRVTHVQMVPTMFVRLLRLTAAERSRYDLTSLRAIVHAAAPCPVEIKAQMIDWLGPIVFEYYSSTEVHLLTAIDSAEWLTHRGSVGRAMLGIPHILDDDGAELPAGEAGTVWAQDGPQFEYHNAPEKTAESRNDRGWTTVGDIGYLDADGYLYLTDRRADMIISGGVNVYPQEAENVLITHPAVQDAAVFGIPHEELGEEVKAVVQLVPTDRLPEEIEAELLAFCHARLAKYKCPRTIDFAAELPRHATGKLYKRLLRDQYAEAARSGA